MRPLIAALLWTGWAYMAVVCSLVAYDELRVVLGQGLDVWELTRPLTPESLLAGAAGLAVALAPGALLVALAGWLTGNRRRNAGTLLRASA